MKTFFPIMVGSTKKNNNNILLTLIYNLSLFLNLHFFEF